MAEFSLNFLDNIWDLYRDLGDKTYRHGKYQAFRINDPKSRDIHKAGVRDRLVHHAIHRILYPYFDRKFIFDSYSCRLKKGTHRAINRFHGFARKVSRNNTRTIRVLKGDIRKFFASIDHRILKNILAKYIADEDTLWLLAQVIDSFTSPTPTPQSASSADTSPRAEEEDIAIGLPLGNLTSQLFVNVYLNELDQFVKRNIKVKYYARYCDDFVIVHEDKNYLENIIPEISEFLGDRLKLSLNPEKVFIKTFSSGVDFLGWVNFPRHRVLRNSTERRMLKNIKRKSAPEVIASYLGLLSHGNTHNLSAKVRKKSL
ncbi:MAG: reverse transcriptase/maturase family protein [Candidatus Moranbacteria bacterium]|nr:reverse transcriptase/maturase family protein [Candidatus Moranbacteria bacterium]